MNTRMSEVDGSSLPLEGQLAIVTGASKGIGQAYAERMAMLGADVASADVDEVSDATKDLVEAQGRRFHFSQVDVTDERATLDFAAAVAKEFGRIDILINNAGIYPYTLFEDMSFAEWRSVMSTNLDGPFLMCKAVVPFMRKAKYGRIVNITSAEVFMPATRNLHYIASKMGVIGLTRALASEVGDDNIVVNCIAPGITDTQNVKDNAPEYLEILPKNGAIKRCAHPEDMANIAAFLVDPRNNYMTGQTLNNDGGLTRV